MQENEKVRGGGNVHPNVLSALTSDGQEIQKEENDTLIIDNRKLNQKIINRFGGPECRSGDTPSIINGKGTVNAKKKKRNKIP